MERRTITAGRGLRVAGQRATVLADIVGRYRMSDGTGEEMEEKVGVKLQLGKVNAHCANTDEY